jgi:hypothetical protein
VPHNSTRRSPAGCRAACPENFSETCSRYWRNCNIHIHREAWLHAVAARLAEPFRRLGYPIPEKTRLSCGFPSVRGIAAKNQRIGECWSNTRSGDDHYEILISPVIADSMRIAGVLAHELTHASVGVEHGHKGTIPSDG